jgi:hypothetical protein
MQAMALSEPRLYEIFKVTVLEVSPYRYDEQEVEADIRTPGNINGD